MAEYRLSQVARKLNVGKNTILEFLKEKGHEVDSNPNSKIPQEQYDMLARAFADSAHDKEEASELTIGGKTDNMVINADKVSADEKSEDERILIKDNVGAEPEPEKISAKTKLDGPKVVGKIDLDKKKKEEKEEEKPVKKEETKKEEPKEEQKKPEEKKEEKPEVKAPEKKESKESDEKKDKKDDDKGVIKAKADSLRGLKVLDKIELPKDKPKPVASSDSNQDRKKRPRKRIQQSGGGHQKGGGRGDRGRSHSGRKTEELSDKEIQDKIKATLAKLSGGGGKGGSQRSKYRKDKRSARAEEEEERQLQAEEASKTLKVTEYISASDLASLMDVSANDVISACMSLGMFVSINQRLDAETITVIADEFGFDVDFTEAKEETDIIEEEDDESMLVDRAPIVTIMGHVDHGKTSLLDYIRESKVTEGEAGGITQHIGAYDVMTNSGKRVAFLDTPGHEAFTAMRARGAKITDVAIIVVAADDSVMPQTKEAINHAQVAGVPIVIAINKVDKPNANPDKIKEDLSNINILVEDWGGKYQCQHVSAKTGEGIDELLDKVLLEAELLELKANPDKPAVGSVVEASLDKGRGYVSTIMVQAGTLKIGDVVLAGPYFGKVKAMFDHRGHKLDKAGPSTPVLMLGLDGAPQAGDKFNVMESDREAREVANKREQILREQSIRTKKHITLDEIGRRLAIGSFKELNVIVKGDVDGSIEALADSLLKLSTEEVQVNILHKAVGQISESDVLLASASDAVIVGFQVRPSSGARKLAETEEIEIRLYSIIYDAINDVKDAMEGMLEPTSEEVITGNIEVRDVFKISKVGTVAGCYVTDGIVKRSNQVRLIRDGIVVYTGEINQLKRFKEDVSEVKNGYECGLSIKNFNDIKVGDIIEGFEVKEVKRTL
ncbi:translation initiation factor IF-2 [Ekhidna sp.]|jgi:translation initiation factor IF-2|uniref:translation initiation factor IF-2 n=1 Tax=Ekhidna sp. TaxID=2608089 RepID=UPI0032EC0706